MKIQFDLDGRRAQPRSEQMRKSVVDDGDEISPPFFSAHREEIDRQIDKIDTDPFAYVKKKREERERENGVCVCVFEAERLHHSSSRSKFEISRIACSFLGSN